MIKNKRIFFLHEKSPSQKKTPNSPGFLVVANDVRTLQSPREPLPTWSALLCESAGAAW